MIIYIARDGRQGDEYAGDLYMHFDKPDYDGTGWFSSDFKWLDEDQFWHIKNGECRKYEIREVEDEG